MKELNELIELAKVLNGESWGYVYLRKHQSHTITGQGGRIIFDVENCKAPADIFSFIGMANPAAIITIAEAYLELEQERDELRQRAEAAEDAGRNVAKQLGEVAARAQKAEQKLAELEKQQPRHFYREHNSYNGMKTNWIEVSAEQLEHLKEITDPDTAEIIELFTRPAPAINLAELVPVSIQPEYEVIKRILPTANPDEYACCVGADMWNACRAAMLRNIEEQAQ